MQRRFAQVDVFAGEPYLGNPVAVVLDGDGLSGEQMQRFARWTNLSETTFVLPPTDPAADYRVRIFTPSAELPFAGHPTLGTCHAWLEAGGADGAREAFTQQCEAGLIRLRRAHGQLAFAAPPLLRDGPMEPEAAQRLASALGLDPADIVEARWADNGPGWGAVLLRDAAAVLALRPGSLPGFDVGAVGPYPPGSPQAVEVRAFFDVDGATREDPVTGSLNASLAPWLRARGLVGETYEASQGTALGRSGRVRLARDADGSWWVGGDTATRIAGQVEL